MPSELATGAFPHPRGTKYDVLCNACDAFLGRPEVFVSPMVSRTRAHHWPEGHDVPAAKIHSTFADMQISARNGCHVCTMILTSFGTPNVRKSIPDTSWILAELYRFPDSMGRNMGTVAVWPTGTSKSSSMNSFFRKFLISHLDIREKQNILDRRSRLSAEIGSRSLDQIRSWMAACCNGHVTCRDSWTLVSKEERLPTRLLEVARSNGEWNLRIVYGNTLHADSEYATLSHCWGSSTFVCLTSENQHTYAINVPFDSLPQTLKDTVELTYALDIKYLWIDSLCIIQDSKVDWLSESSTMGRVYAQGHLNIAATYSQNGDGGLFNQSNLLDASPCIIQMTDNDDTASEAIFYQDSVWDREVERAPLGKRAWVVQERVLAPRIVHFSSNQILWECCQGRAAELLPADAVDGDGELKKTTPYPGTTEGQDPDCIWVHQNWAYLVEKYSSCSLTIPSDKLVAISGLARRACGQLGLTPQHYAAGLWTSNLIYGLLYRVSRDSNNVTRGFPDRAPTWSWASIDGEITSFPQDHGSLTKWPYTTVVDVQTDHNGDPFGQLLGGSIWLQGPLAELPPETFFCEMWNGPASQKSITFTAASTAIFLDEPPSENEVSLGPVYFLLLIVDSKIDEPAEIHGLLLCPTGHKRGQFRRIGVLIYGEAGDFEMSLRSAKDPAKLDESLYIMADAERGFTIEII